MNEKDLSARTGIKSAWSTGGQMEINMGKIPLTLGAAYGVIEPHASSLLNEKITEVYIKHQINKWTHISPHFQYVANAGGIAKSYMLIGLRTQFNF